MNLNGNHSCHRVYRQMDIQVVLNEGDVSNYFRSEQFEFPRRPTWRAKTSIDATLIIALRSDHADHHKRVLLLRRGSAQVNYDLSRRSSNPEQ